MRVRRDFDRIYAEQADPWHIGDADDARYDAYVALVLRHAAARGTILDAGCGMGAFLARFRETFAHLEGVDVSAEAVTRASARFPEGCFRVGSVDQLARVLPDEARYDAVICSDVLYYLPEPGRRRTLAWIAGHLAADGVALLAAWCPGGDYLEAEELRHLVRRDFAIREELVLESGHLALLVERKRRVVALTFDYETWQPIPEGRTIDWQLDVFEPAERLLAACREEGARITLFAEMGEYLWLCANEPAIAGRMAEQWRSAIRDGHEIGLHLHPSWLPEVGARHDDGVWTWDAAYAKANAWPGDLAELIGRCKAAIEDAVRPVAADYAVETFRAGAYQAQPFLRLAAALVTNGIHVDSSVFAGGLSAERGYDYRLAWSDAAPYYASPYDPQLKAVPAETGILELPIRTDGGGVRLMLDGDEGERFAERIVADADRRYASHPTSAQLRRQARKRQRLTRISRSLRAAGPLVELLVPRPLLRKLVRAEPEHRVGHDYTVAIGHTKGDLRVGAIQSGIRRLVADGRFELVPLAEAARLARAELDRGTPTDAHAAPRPAVAESTALAARLQALIPLDRERVLSLDGDPAAAQITERFPWMHVTELDAGSDLGALAVPDGAFDCVDAGTALAGAHHIDTTLRELARVLVDGGVVVAGIPSDARNPSATVAAHTWKTAPGDVRARLAEAGFGDVELDEVDTVRTLGLGPYPPALDRLMLIRAWKRPAPVSQSNRADEAMDWIYRRLDPSTSSTSPDPLEVIAGGHAFCAGYAMALGELLRREGIPVWWVTMEAAGHPRGHGPEQIDTHTLLTAILDGREQILDPMSNVRIPHALLEGLRDPTLAAGRPPDERWTARGYDLYATAFWYERVRRYQRFDKHNPHLRRWHRAPGPPRLR